MAAEKSQPLKSGKKNKKPKAAKPGERPGATKRKKAKKKKTNPLFLLIAIGFGFAGLIGIGSLLVWYSSRTGKIEEILKLVPGECNWARGVNMTQLRGYPGYKAEVDKFYTEPVKSAAEELGKSAGQDPETFLDYLVIAKNRKTDGSVGTMYVFRTLKSIDPNLPGSISGAKPETVSGQACYRMPAKAPGILANAIVYCPSDRHIVIFPAGGQQASMAADGMKAKGAPGESFGGKLDETGKMVVKGSIWLLVKTTGGNANYIKDNVTGPVKEDFGDLDKQGQESPTFGMWSSPGGTGVRIGVAMQCVKLKESTAKKDAEGIVKGVKNGPMGKSDESEAPNKLKSAAGQVVGNQKLFTEYMQNCEFKNKDGCIFMTSTVTGENAKSIMGLINNPTVASGEGNNNGGAFMPPGGGAPAQAGLPGGVVIPP